MSEGVIAAIITGTFALIGTIISNKFTENKIQQQLIVNQAVYDTKLEELTRETRKHNSFAERMPVVEEQIREANRRINNLEEFHKKDWE